jgi:hypothetical protein
MGMSLAELAISGGGHGAWLAGATFFVALGVWLGEDWP